MGWELFVVSVLVYAAIPLLLAIHRTAFQFVLLYSHIAAVLTVGGFLGTVYVLTVEVPVLGEVSILAGQNAYAAFIFATLLATVVGRDLQVVRNVIALTIGVNVLMLLLYRLGDRALNEPSVGNPLGVPSSFFERSTPTILWGGLLIIAELVVLIGVLEWAKRRLPSPAMVAVYPLAYLGTLLLDGLLFPVLVVRPESGLDEVVLNAVAAKAVLGVAFAVPLLLFVTLYRGVVTGFEAQPLAMHQLLVLGRDELLLGRATATVERILDSAVNTMLVVLDQDLRITHFNAGAEKVLGLRAETMLGKTTVDMVPADEIARQARALGVPGELRALTEAQVRAGTAREWQLVDAHGNVCVVSLSVSEICSDGRCVGYLVAGEDVTTRVRSERAMMLALQREHEAKQALHEADTVKHELVSTVSHELRTPITSITGYAELLEEGVFGRLNDRQCEALGKVMRNTQRLETLVEDLLVLERVESGRMTFDKQPMDLRDAVTQIEDMLVEMVRGRDIRLNLRVPEQPLPVLGDQSALERVVLNLVSNAAKFTPSGGEVTVQMHPSEGHAMLRVSDTGIGISAQDQERLFTRFFRTREAHARAIPGSGLGLSIVQAIVSGHDGRITVLSTPGRGTTMAISLPSADSSS